MERSKKATCRRVRAWLQDVQDGEASAAPAAWPQAMVPLAAVPSRFARAAEAHLERCPRCRSFREFLSGYGQELSAALDGLTSHAPFPDLPAFGLATRRDRPAGSDPARPARREPARRRIAWAVPAAAAALLAVAAGIQAPRVAAGVRLERRVRAELAALVEELYAHPLAQGVESDLAGRTLWEGLAEGDGLQSLGEGEGPPGPGGDFLPE